MLQREAKEELGINVETSACPFLGMRVCRADCSENYKIREFQHFFAIFIDKTLKDMDFLITDGEVKSVVEIVWMIICLCCCMKKKWFSLMKWYWINLLEKVHSILRLKLILSESCRITLMTKAYWKSV